MRRADVRVERAVEVSPARRREPQRAHIRAADVFTTNALNVAAGQRSLRRRIDRETIETALRNAQRSVRRIREADG